MTKLVISVALAAWFGMAAAQSFPTRQDRVVITLPFENPATPGISGKLRFVAREWNSD